MAEKNIGLMVQNRVRQYGDRVALKVKRDGAWQEISWNQLNEKVRQVALGLVSLGLAEGENVCLLAENRPEWAESDLGILSAAGVTVPIYATNTPAQVEYIVRDSQARFLIVSTPEQLAKALEIRERLPRLERVIIFDPPPGRIPDRVVTFEELLQRGARFADPGRFDQLVAKPTRGSLLTIIYTSGTTGDPKGAMLTHGNLLSNVEATTSILTLTDQDTCLSFLPLSHVFERMAGYYTMLYRGAPIAYAEGLEQLVENLAEIRPTVMCAVPRFYEKLYARIHETVAGSPALRQRIFHWAVGVGRQVSALKQAKKPIPLGLRIKYGLAYKLVFSKFAHRLGGRLRFFVSGGAPLAREIAEFFHAAGILILEGYGLTETSPVISCNREEDYKFGTVGKPIPGVEVRIAGDGEILCRGASVMKGYFNLPEATRQAVDGEGWFHTGDIGELDAEGFLRITDRKKDLIVTAQGKNIAPQMIENLLKMNPLIEQAVVIGDRRPYLIALISPSFQNLEKVAAERGIAFQDRVALVREPALQELFQQAVEGVNGKLARFETIKRFAVVPEEFTQATGELTPTLKVKRRVLEQRYADLIERLYRGERGGGEEYPK